MSVKTPSADAQLETPRKGERLLDVAAYGVVPAPRREGCQQEDARGGLSTTVSAAMPRDVAGVPWQDPPVSAPVVGWTADEAWLLAELGRRALVASLDGAPPQRVGEGTGFDVEVRASADEIVLDVRLEAERATFWLEPLDDEEHRFRQGWAFEIEWLGDRWTLFAGGGTVTVQGARGVLLCARPRVKQLAVRLPIDGDDEVVPVADAAFHRYTRQSTRSAPTRRTQPIAPWMSPTEPEARPFWEIDLGRTLFVEWLRADLERVPEGARVVIVAYAYAARSGEPPPGSFTHVLEPDGTRAGGRRVIEARARVMARHVRVTLIAAPGTVAVLAIRALEVVAADPFADTIEATMRRCFALHGARPLFVARPEGAAGYAFTHTHAEVWAQAMALARGLAMRLERGPNARDDERIFVAIMTHNRPEWVMADLAALARGYVVVPIAPGEPEDRLAQILAQARVSVAICEPGEVERLAAASSSLRLIVVCDAAAGGAPASEATPVGAVRVRFEDLVVEGRAASVPPPAARRPEDVQTVLFTSGSTGAPKGAMRSYATFQAILMSYGLDQDSRHLSFQPLSHVSERMFLPAMLVQGATIAFSRGGAHLLDELRAFEPTVIGSVPRLYDVLHATYRRELADALAASPDRPRAEVEEIELHALRGVFGGRVRALSVGSAPVSAEVLAFLRRCFADIWVSEGYGTTELGTIAVDGKVQEHVEVKITPAPGAPAPWPGAPERGQLWVRTPHLISGYLGRPEALTEATDADGFFATGDLVERDADGTVRVVGRLSSTVKLAQGEFVSAERVESALGGAPVVDRIFVHAAPGAPGVAALVVPVREVLARLLSAGDAVSLEELIARREAPEAVLGALRAHGRREGQPAWELPRGVLLLAADLTSAEGLLTASGKLARGAIAARYGAQLAVLAADEPPAAEVVPVDAGDLPARLARVASRVLGRALEPCAPLAEAGVDSLATAEILAALRRDLGREVPLAVWFEARSLDDLAARLDRFATPAQTTSAEVVADLEPAPLSVPTAHRLPLRSILLTGATGLLGAHLVAALAERSGLEILCLVRATDDRDALRRVEGTLASYDLPTPAPGRLRAFAGDLAAPRLGLSEAAYREIGERADAILHAGASVSWLASYAAVRGPNVGGTAALLDLATRGRARPFHFVSTISVAPVGGDEDTTLTLDAVRVGTPYGLSKWIAEAQVRRAARTGLPVALYRPGMIAGASRSGHGNADDFLHRYLVGVAELGLYLDRDDARLDMTPVDFVAAAIAALVIAEPLGGATHHLVNVDQSPTYRALGQALASAGLAVAPASYEVFRAALERAPSSRLAGLAAFFPAGGFGLGMGPWPCARTVKRLASLGVPRPVIDAGLIGRYVASLRRRGLLPDR